MTISLQTCMQSYGMTLILATLMMLFYELVLQRRAEYRFGRIYLIGIPALCLILPCMHSLANLLFAGGEESVLHMSQAEARTYCAIHPEAQIMEGENADIGEVLPTSVSTWWQETVWQETIALGIAMVSLVLVLHVLIQMVRLWRLSDKMPAEESEAGYRLIRSLQVKTPFSLGKTIFLPKGMASDSERIVIRHEGAHIQCRHYVDVWVVELLTRLMWFNPVLWLVRNRLRNLHEFQADRIVLDTGTDILTYQTLLLEEVMEDSTVIANGFNHSFIRRRFMEMKRGKRPAMGIASKGATALWLILLCGVTVAYCMPASVPTMIRIVEQNTPKVSAQETNAVKENTLKDSMSYAPKAKDGWPILHKLPEYKGTAPTGKYMKRDKTETLLTYIVTCTTDNAFYKFGGPDAYLVDPETNTHYVARHSIPAEAWNFFHLEGMKGKTFMVTIVFPPLPDSVKDVELYQVRSHLQSGER